MFKVQDILIKRYQLQQPLGRTAIGRQTWLATDLQSQESVIVKLLAFSPQMQWEELKLFEREAQVLASLTHPRLPRYRDYFDIDKNAGEGISWFILVQDYLPGSSLQDLLEAGKRFTEKEILSIATEVLEILIYLHELSPPVLHRDIKPSNLILGSDNQVYLVDFGAVQAQGAVTGVTFTVVGTSGYAPLEQFWGRAVPASDLYALGATLIHLLTGVSPMDLPHQDSRIQFADRVSIKADLIDWLETITNLAVEKRFGSAKEALKALTYRKNSKVAVYSKLDKPLKSRIQLNRSYDKLKIYFPPSVKISSFQSVFAIAILVPFILFVLLTSVFSYPFLLIFAIIITTWFLKKIYKTHIEFDSKQVIIQYKILEIIYKEIIFKVDDILGIFLCSNESGNQIKICTDKNSYWLGDRLREDECIWLAKEIQDWLSNRRDRYR